MFSFKRLYYNYHYYRGKPSLCSSNFTTWHIAIFFAYRSFLLYSFASETGQVRLYTVRVVEQDLT